MKNLSIIVFKENDWWVAQCLEHDIVAQAKTLPDLQYELQRVIICHIVASVENEIEPFKHLPAAPKNYWEMYDQASYLESRDIPFRLPDSAPIDYAAIPKRELRICS